MVTNCDPPTRDDLTFGIEVRFMSKVRVLELDRDGKWGPNEVGNRWDRDWKVVVVCEERGAGCVQKNVRLACDADCEDCCGEGIMPFRYTESIACSTCKGRKVDRDGKQRVIELPEEEYRALVAEGVIKVCQ